MKQRMLSLSKGLTVTVILLFIGVAVQPSIGLSNNDDDLVEITIEIYELDKTYNHTVMLTQNQKDELEKLINNFEIKLNASGSRDKAEAIFKDTVVSLNQLGILPDSMSVEEAQRLVLGEEQNSRNVKLFKRCYSNNQKGLFDNDNILCLIAGETINTVFIGPFALLFGLLFGLHGALSFLRHYELLIWFNINVPNLWNWWVKNFGEIHEKLLFLRTFFWIAFGVGLNLLPLKIGAYIHYGWFTFSFYPWDESEDIPAEGWVKTFGLFGKKEWSGNFYGDVLGFTGLKITNELLDHFYLGAALRLYMEDV